GGTAAWDGESAGALGLRSGEAVQPPAGHQPTKEEAALAYEEGGRTHVPFAGEGTAVNSGSYTGLPTAEFKQRITAALEGRGLGSRKVNYKLRDWLFSRQRYWGEPFPVL